MKANGWRQWGRVSSQRRIWLDHLREGDTVRLKIPTGPAEEATVIKTSPDRLHLLSRQGFMVSLPRSDGAHNNGTWIDPHAGVPQYAGVSQCL